MSKLAPAAVAAAAAAQRTTPPPPRRFRIPQPPIFPATPRPRLPASARRARIPVWTPPLRPGKLRAFDEAVKYIRSDARVLRAELAALKDAYTKHAAADARAGRVHDPAARDAYVHRRDLLDIMANVNLPEVRAAFKSGHFPFAQPVYRHLTEQKWRKDGALDLLMERIYQMHVVPDLLPAFHPTADLRVQFRTAPSLRTRGFVPVEPGSFLLPAQTLAPPRVSATVFHPEPRLYTLILLDPDVPDESRHSFQTYVHWLQPNISLAGTRRINLIPSDASPLLPYVPPHPQRGTPYHRYVLLLLPHADATAPLALPDATLPLSRSPFDLRAFCGQHGLDPARGGGVHMWRAVWDATVSDVYRDVLATPEPRFGVPPRPDAAAYARTRSRYSYAL